MKYEEAIKVFKKVVACHSKVICGCNLCKDCENDYSNVQLCRSLEFAIDRAERYSWHDLRKNPEDLPTKDGYYLCIFEDSIKPEVYCYFDDAKYFGEWRTDYHYELDSCPIETFFEPYEDDEFKIIAWRYIEPFEEGHDASIEE